MLRRLFQLDFKYGVQNYKSLPVMIQKGKGVFLYDTDNKQYYDWVSAYSSVNQGHCHPKLVKIMKAQCEKLTLCSRAFHSENLSYFFKYMNTEFGYDRCLPMNTGTEACESAIKLARLWGYQAKQVPTNKAEIIVARNNFWGRSIAACSSSTSPETYENFGPYVPGFRFVDYNNISDLWKEMSVNPNIVGFMIEPIQGEAGIQLPSFNYLYRAKKMCEEFNILMICDEVQTGIGRTGSMTVSNEESIKPDLLVLGKALSGGMIPISCVLGNEKVMKWMTPGTHGSTFGGNPLATAIAPKAIDLIYEEDMLQNAQKQGMKFRVAMEPYVEKGVLLDVRGRGLMNAIEFEDPLRADDFVKECLRHGVLTKITKGGTIRMCPPLIITDEEMEHSIEIIQSVLEKYV